MCIFLFTTEFGILVVLKVQILNFYMSIHIIYLQNVVMSYIKNWIKWKYFIDLKTDRRILLFELFLQICKKIVLTIQTWVRTDRSSFSLSFKRHKVESWSYGNFSYIRYVVLYFSFRDQLSTKKYQTRVVNQYRSTL